MRKEHHIGFVVTDVEAATRKFVKEGCEVVKEAADEPSQGVKVAFVRPPGASIPLELVAPLGPDSPVRSRLAHGGGLDHIGYETEDLEGDVEEEVKRGAKVLCQPVLAVNLQRRIAFVYRRSGLVVELVERAADDTRPI